MEKLGTFLLFAFVFSTLKQTLHANNNCFEPKFLNQENDFFCVQVNQDINITFALDWVDCSLSTSEHVINVVANNSSHGDGECRLSVNKSTCRVSDNTPGCWCMSPTGPVTFTERFTRAANITYVLQWHRGHVVKEKSVTVRVFKVSPTCGKTHGGEEYNCADIRFLNQHDDVIYLNVNDYINITFAIDWVNCSFATSGRFLKVVARTIEQPEDECKIILIKGTCSVSNISPFFCMTTAGPITFYKRITKPVNMTYEWLWYHGDEAKQKAVTVHILDVPLEETTCCDTGVVVAVVVGTCCVLAVVAIVIILFICKKVMRTKNPSPQKEKTTQHSGVSPPQNETGDISVHLAQYEDVCDATHSQNNAGSRVTSSAPTVDRPQSETHIYYNDGVESQEEVYTEFTC